MSGPAYERILDRLREDGHRVDQRGDRAQAQCPAHDDRNPSLSIKGIEGSVLVRCQAGCGIEDVLAALEMTKADLYDDHLGARYDYLDASGSKVLRTVIRTPEKAFRQNVIEKDEVTLFRLPQVVEAVEAGWLIYLVEGEKDVLALESIGLVATSAPMGANNFSKVDVAPLTGAKVTAIVDRDEAGKTWAAQVLEVLHPIVATISFKHAAVGKDAADHVAAGLGVVDLLELPAPGPTLVGTKERMKSSAPGLPLRDPAMFRGLLGDIVEAADPYTEGDPVGVLVSLMAGAGALLNQRPHTMIGNTRHPLLIWPLLFGLTGSGRKGEAASAAKQFLRLASDTFDEISVTGLSSGEGLIERIKDPVEIDEDSKRRYEWPGTADKRLLVTEPEFASVMARAKREGNTLAGVLRECWEGGRMGVLTKAHVRASSSHIAIAGHVTPKEFRLRLVESDLAGGTYNRFLPVYVERSKRLPLPDPVPEWTLRQMSKRLSNAIAQGSLIDRIKLSKPAAALWKDELYDEFSGDDEDTPWAQFARRAAPYCLRIAALHACLDVRNEISFEDLVAAAALVRFSIDSAKYVLDRTTGDHRLDKICRTIEESVSGYATKTEISTVFGRNTKADVLDELIDQVVASGKYKQITIPAPKGRPAVAYAKHDFILSFVSREGEVAQPQRCLDCGQQMDPAATFGGFKTCPSCAA